MTSSARIERRPWGGAWDHDGQPYDDAAQFVVTCAHRNAVLYAAGWSDGPLDEQHFWRQVVAQWRRNTSCGCTVPAQLVNARGFGEGA